ncbi:MAG: hypothetical protein ABW034_05775, partial [Steroidobacteraceae bacterium]
MNLAMQLRKVSTLLAVGGLVGISGFSNEILAAPLALQNVPLFISTGAEPNVMIMLDNSGSMQNIVP